MSSGGLLSRLAESLYWIGRYIERADDTARIVDSYVHRMAEDPYNDEAATCRSLFSILGVDDQTGEPPDVTRTLHVIAYDESNRHSIASSFLGAYENARRSREFISSEMWVALNTTCHALARVESTARALGPATYLQYVRERAALLAGLADTTMSHDDGWHFLVLGRSIERIDMTARLLRGRVVAGPNAPDWLALLRASGAMESFMRSARGAHDAQLIVAFLLLDRDFPRSILYSLDQADLCLTEVQPTTPHGRGDRARQVLSRARGTLEFIDRHDLLDQLAELLVMLEESCATIHDAVTERYFRYEESGPWTIEGAL